MLFELSFYTKTLLGLRELTRVPPLPDPENVIRRQAQEREDHFLEMVNRLVFSNPNHPYFQMLELAGCSFADLRSLVRGKGLEYALEQLYESGVYLTHAEFKGTQPVIRAGRPITVPPNSLQNPLNSGGIISISGGSRSRGTRTLKGTSLRLYHECWRELQRREWGLDGLLPVSLFPMLPSTIFLTSGVSQSRAGAPFAAWFTQGGLRDQAASRWATRSVVLMARLCGARLPYPRFLPANDYRRVAAWIARRKREQGQSCAVWGFASAAARVAGAALDAGLDIRDTVFLAGGEPLTPPKRELIERAGARAHGNYYISEIGAIGSACRQMNSDNTVHLHTDSVAAITRPLQLRNGVRVNALFYTTLLPCTPYLLINAEMGDAGELGTARCDCTFTRLGFTRQIRGLYSFSKLTGAGITLLDNDVVRILEETIPRRFGGKPGDYQLVESEEEGRVQITLRVSRRAGNVVPEKIRTCFLQELRSCFGGSLATRSWIHDDSLRVEVAEPLTTKGGKVLILHLIGTKENAAGSS